MRRYRHAHAVARRTERPVLSNGISCPPTGASAIEALGRVLRASFQLHRQLSEWHMLGGVFQGDPSFEGRNAFRSLIGNSARRGYGVSNSLTFHRRGGINVARNFGVECHQMRPRFGRRAGADAFKSWITFLSSSAQSPVSVKFSSCALTLAFAMFSSKLALNPSMPLSLP